MEGNVGSVPETSADRLLIIFVRFGSGSSHAMQCSNATFLAGFGFRGRREGD